MRDDADGDGYAPIHGAQLLGRLRADRASPGLVAALRDVEPMDILYSTLIHALTDMGEVVIEPLLVLVTSTDDEDTLDAAAEVLSKLGVNDRRIFTFQLRRLAANTDLGASFLATYGDPAALPHLHRAFGTLEIDRMPR